MTGRIFLMPGAPIFAALAFAILPSAVVAAPQALGLVATAEPTPLQCEDGVCQGFFTAFCLQEKRLPPGYGFPYRPGETSQITLLITTDDNRRITLPGRGLLDFESHNTYSSVNISVDEARIAAYRPKAVSVQIAPLASLIPIDVPGDRAPQTPAELDKAIGSDRLAAKHFFDEGDLAGEAALTAMLINMLPKSRSVSRSARADIWRQAVASRAARKYGETSVARARQNFYACRRTVDSSTRMTLRDCLEVKHRARQVETNRSYWKSLNGF